MKLATNGQALLLVCESTGVVTRFTDYRAPKPHSRPACSFPRTETFQHWLK